MNGQHPGLKKRPESGMLIHGPDPDRRKMLNPIERYSISELIFSLERELDKHKKQEQPDRDEKAVRELEMQLTFLWEFLLTRE
jgi:hypothetical protein